VRKNTWVLGLTLEASFVFGCGSSPDAASNGASSGGGKGANGGASANGGAGTNGGTGAGAPAGTGGSGTTSGTGLTVSPKSVVVPPSGTQAFHCTVAGSPNATCTWSVTEMDGGTVGSDGQYTAPATPGTFHVVATNSADATQTDTATVVVRLPAAAGCDNLGPVGQWQSVTPPDVPLPGAAPCDFGTQSFVVDPQMPSTVYLGTCQYGIWKSTHCGSDWTHVNTGTHGDAIYHSRQWTFVIDPIDPNVLYTNAGYNMIEKRGGGTGAEVGIGQRGSIERKMTAT